MNKTIEVLECSGCMFYGSVMDKMECRHPYWVTHREEYAAMLEIQDGENKLPMPAACPLQTESIILTIKKG